MLPYQFREPELRGKAMDEVTQEEQEYWERVQIFIPGALAVVAHASSGTLVLRDSDYVHDETGEIVGVNMPPMIHGAALIIAQNMYRFASN